MKELRSKINKSDARKKKTLNIYVKQNQIREKPFRKNRSVTKSSRTFMKKKGILRKFKKESFRNELDKNIFDMDH